jgi:hypothetical protein
MQIPGYDDWKLSGPPEWEGPTCEFCGDGGDIRVINEGYSHQPATLICEGCFTPLPGGPDWEDLTTAAEYAQEQADLEADYRYDQASN